MGLMGIVGGDEVGECPFGGVEVRELGTLEALLAEDSEPGFSEPMLLHVL
jgi:hypothetical protein